MGRPTISERLTDPWLDQVVDDCTLKFGILKPIFQNLNVSYESLLSS